MVKMICVSNFCLDEKMIIKYAKWKEKCDKKYK